MEFPPLTQSLLKELVPCWLSRLPPCVQAVNLVAYNMANITVLLRGDIFFFPLYLVQARSHLARAFIFRSLEELHRHSVECFYIHAGTFLCIFSRCSAIANCGNHICTPQSVSEEKGNNWSSSCFCSLGFSFNSYVAVGTGC